MYTNSSGLQSAARVALSPHAEPLAQPSLLHKAPRTVVDTSWCCGTRAAWHAQECTHILGGAHRARLGPGL